MDEIFQRKENREMALSPRLQYALLARLSLPTLEALTVPLPVEFWQNVPTLRYTPQKLGSLDLYPTNGLTSREAALAICSLHGEVTHSSLLFLPFSLGLLSAARNSQNAVLADFLQRLPSFDPGTEPTLMQWTSYSTLLALMHNNVTATAQLLAFFQSHFEYLQMYYTAIGFGYCETRPIEAIFRLLLQWLHATKQKARKDYLAHRPKTLAEATQHENEFGIAEDLAQDRDVQRAMEESFHAAQQRDLKEFLIQLDSRFAPLLNFLLGYAEERNWFRLKKLAEELTIVANTKSAEFATGVCAAVANTGQRFYLRATLFQEAQAAAIVQFDLQNEDLQLTNNLQLRALGWLATNTLLRFLTLGNRPFPKTARLLLRYPKVIRRRAPLALELIETIYLASPEREAFLDTLRLFTGQVRASAELDPADLLLAGRSDLIPKTITNQDLKEAMQRLPNFPDLQAPGELIDYLDIRGVLSENEYYNFLYAGWSAGHCWAVARINSSFLSFPLNARAFANLVNEPYGDASALTLIRSWRDRNVNYTLNVTDWFLIETLAPELTFPEIVPVAEASKPPKLYLRWQMLEGPIFYDKPPLGDVYFFFVTAYAIQVLQNEGVNVPSNTELELASADFHERIQALLQ